MTARSLSVSGWYEASDVWARAALAAPQQPNTRTNKMTTNLIPRWTLTLRIFKSCTASLNKPKVVCRHESANPDRSPGENCISVKTGDTFDDGLQARGQTATENKSESFQSPSFYQTKNMRDAGSISGQAVKVKAQNISFNQSKGCLIPVW